VEGERRVPVGIDLATYRIVQEALTNALKHARGAPVHVRLGYRARFLVADVNSGPAASGTARGPRGAGHGLIGMRERAIMYGGTLEASPRRNGGFRVTVAMPLPAEDR
jgi:signal transduction histidine kinase